MSANTSCRERAAAFLERVRRGEAPGPRETKALGEECTREFFRIVIEPLADSFGAREAAIYEELMGVWIPRARRVAPRIPDHVDQVFVLSRVTLGADIKIVSPILNAMRARFPRARVTLAGSRKSAELFEAERGIGFLEANYPGAESIEERLAFAARLRREFDGDDRIVIDPDSRMTQLGLIPLCSPERYFHFPSRTAGGDDQSNLTDLVSDWLGRNFEDRATAWIAPRPVRAACERPMAAVSLGVGENESKRFGLEFERQLISMLAARFRTVYLDRGAGGAEAARVSEAARASGAMDRARFHEGSFAAFASIIAQSDFYVGYDSAGQHAAAAVGVPAATIFRGAPSARFRNRWAPASRRSRVIDADALTAEACLAAVEAMITGHL